MGKELNQAGSSFYEKIGVAFEFPNFYQRLTALENLNLFRSLYASETEEPEALLALIGLEDYGRTKVSAYSKGMKMRLNFSRALINQPDLLFLDEPTSGLDPVHAKKLKQLILNKKAEGKTILITTHHMQTAEEICDRVAFIVDGRVALIDFPRALKVQKGKRHVKVEYRNHRQLETAQFDLDQIGSSPEFLNLIKERPFYYAYLLISTVYIAVLQFLPVEYREAANIALTFSDPSVLGFFFIGGLVLLEKGQNIHDSLFVTPLSESEYILSKTASLSVLSLGSSIFIHSSVFGFGTNSVMFACGVLFTSFFFTMIGLGLAVRCETLNGFFFLSSLSTFVFVLPLFETAGIWSKPAVLRSAVKGLINAVRFRVYRSSAAGAHLRYFLPLVMERSRVFVGEAFTPNIHHFKAWQR